jgi:hypothetical protein
MANTLKDRIRLRQLRKSLNNTPFGKQNKRLAKPLNIDPAWIYQSRLNFRYIFNDLNAFWPDWAERQLSPFSDHPKQHSHELTCLNTSTRETFSFFGKNNESHQLEINNKGFISFPYLHWGLSIQCLGGDTFSPFFKSELRLNSEKPTIDYLYEDEQKINHKMSLAIDDAFDTPYLFITIKNNGLTAFEKNLSFGIVPFTNEGVGGIRTIQYLSSNQMIVNDHSVVTMSRAPSNILCTRFEDGNIFECSKTWDMILSCKCDDFLASGLMAYNIQLDPNESFSLILKIQHAKAFITPLFYPLSKINHLFLTKNTEFTESTDSQVTETAQISFQSLPKQYQKLPLITQNFLLHTQHNSALFSTEMLYFTLLSLFKLNAHDHVNQLISFYENQPKKFMSISGLSQNQNIILNHFVVIDLIHRYRFDAPEITGRLIQKIHKLIAKDSFFHFIKRLSIKSFNHHIHSSKNIQFLIKLMLFQFISNQLSNHKLSTNQTNECQHICTDYLKLAFNNQTLMHAFKNNFFTNTILKLNETLFLLHYAFDSILSDDLKKAMSNDLMNRYWNHNQVIDTQQFSGHSEKTELLFSTLSPPDVSHIIIKNYMERINSFGEYYHPQSPSFIFHSYPKKQMSYHAIFIPLFCNQLSYSKNKSLYICAPMYFTNINISQINTMFGKLSLVLSASNIGLKVTLQHEFRISPKQIIMLTPPKYCDYRFSNLKSTRTPINNGCVDIPLNETVIHLS